IRKRPARNRGQLMRSLRPMYPAIHIPRPNRTIASLPMLDGQYQRAGKKKSQRAYLAAETWGYERRNATRNPYSPAKANSEKMMNAPSMLGPVKAVTKAAGK